MWQNYVLAYKFPFFFLSHRNVYNLVSFTLIFYDNDNDERKKKRVKNFVLFCFNKEKATIMHNILVLCVCDQQIPIDSFRGNLYANKRALSVHHAFSIIYVRCIFIVSFTRSDKVIFVVDSRRWRFVSVCVCLLYDKFLLSDWKCM